MFCRGRLVRRWRRATASLKSTTAAALRTLKSVSGRRDMASIEGVCIASVVPRLNRVFREACLRALDVRPLFATPRTIGIDIGKYNPRQIGADRLVNALAAYERYKRPVIVVDVGTAITVDAIDRRGKFLGGAIVPGPAMMAEALASGTARIPLVSMSRPRKAIGISTDGCVRSGIYFGSAGLIDRIVRSISRQMRVRPVVIATGGAVGFARASETIEHILPNLTLEGLWLVWNARCGPSGREDVGTSGRENVRM